jgi:hypothetical protein
VAFGLAGTSDSLIITRESNEVMFNGAVRGQASMYTKPVNGAYVTNT